MKNGKKLTLRQKKMLSNQGLNPDDWLRTKDLCNSFEIVNNHTKEDKKIDY